VSLAFAFMVLAIVIGLWGNASEGTGSIVREKAQQSGQLSSPPVEIEQTETGPTEN
jgi:hypothetical protein